MKSAIDWDLVTRARRAQEKLARYFALLEEVRSLEADPEVAAFLASGESVESPAVAPVIGAGSPALPPPSPPEVPAPVAPLSDDRSPRIERYKVMRAVHQLEKDDFDAPELLLKFKEIYASHYPEYAAVEARQINDHLRRMEKESALVRTEEGRRGRRGSFPRYKLVVKATAAGAK
jgi:hypothetical protein